MPDLYACRIRIAGVTFLYYKALVVNNLCESLDRIYLRIEVISNSRPHRQRDVLSYLIGADKNVTFRKVAAIEVV